MPQFELYRNPSEATQQTYPYLLDIQSDLLDQLRTTVVIPLMPQRLAVTLAMSRLNPVLSIDEEDFILLTQNLSGVSRSALGERVGDLMQHRSEIVAAVDFLLSGI
jgi:toxin CcdB